MKRESSNALVGRLRAKAMRLQKLRSVARDQVMDAELAYEDLTRQCKESWEDYHMARKQQPPNTHPA